MDALPAEVLYRSADVTDAEAMARLVTEITARDGRLTGVIHAAGLLRDGVIANKREADLRAVLAPKVAGVAALDAATAHLDLDVMVLFASAASALGNVGQADYAAANAFLDGFAATRNARVAAGQRRGRTLALDWPYWADGGMRLDGAILDAMARDVGVRPLTRAAALARAGRRLCSDRGGSGAGPARRWRPPAAPDGAARGHAGPDADPCARSPTRPGGIGSSR